MFRWGFAVGALLPCATSLLLAQTAAHPVDPVFVRAQALVSDGNGVAGRALIDSVLHATPPGAPLYPQALFWRASLASNAADAESDYKHIVVDYPLAPQAEDALLRLAQLELARGDRDGALAHLQRIPRDYPRSKSVARANYWTARVLFEKNDVTSACAANASALSQTGGDEIELRNQIQYQGQRCASLATAPPPTKTPPAIPDTQDTKARILPRSDSATSTQATKATAETKSLDAVPPKQSASKGEFSVQVAAYNHKPDAEKLSDALSKRGYSARVDGDSIPFRVRIGRYSTSAEAEEALKRIKAKHMEGFVVRAPER
jgi:cell division septation protein DedD